MATIGVCTGIYKISIWFSSDFEKMTKQIIVLFREILRKSY